LIFYVDDNLENAFAKLIKNFAAEKKSFQLSQVVGVRLLARRDDPKKIDPHLWLNPQNAIKIAEFMAQKICAIDAPNCRKYQKNSEKFIREIRATEKSIQDAFASVKVSNYIIFHDGYQYFENYFGLTPLYVMSYDQHRDLTIQDLRRFDELAASGQVKCVFGDSLNEKNSAAKLAQNYKIKFTILNSMKAEESPNKTSYPALLRRIAEGMVNCLK
jgi:zinc transport system substrate-binding protein